MDEIDRKILYEIAENARDSHNILAKKIRCSREVFDYRLKKLEKEKIILGFQARTNLSNFIYAGYVLLIQSSGLNTELEKKIIDNISKNSQTQYLGKINGEYDIIIGFTIKNLKELSEYLDFINEAFKNKKSKLTLLTMIKEIKDSFKYIFSKDEKIIDSCVSLPELNKQIIVDEIDKKILIQLSKNSEIASWEIGEKIKISEVAIRKRISKLMRERIILNFRTMIDLTKLDYQSYFIFLKSNPNDKKTENDFQQYLSNKKNISYASKTIGEYSYILTVLVKNINELKDFLYEIKNQFPEMTQEMHSSALFEMPYHTQLAENILE
jgi:DNA-binding Lrp family transcriptional regulator